jgi:hypothetical protein
MTGPVVLSRTITNTFGEIRQDAQYIGDLNNTNTFNIALTGTLAPRDKGDFYSFRVTTSNTFVRLAAIQQADTSSTSGSSATSSTTPSSDLTDLVKTGVLRYQVYSQTGKVIADSNPNAGDAYTAYQSLTTGTNLSLGRGTYTVKVSPGDNADSHTTYDYLFNLEADATPIPDGAGVTSREEFQTTASAATNPTNPLQTTGWLPTVITPTSTTTSLFSALNSLAANPSALGGSIDVTI